MTADWLNVPAKTPSTSAREAATAHQGMLTKPPGALGQLEEVAITLAGMLDNPRPRVDKVRIVVFAGDHGIAEEGVSAFPQAVTTEMVRNFARGGAAISVLARNLGAELEVVNLGTVNDPGPLPGVLDQRLAPSTANFAREPAMSEQQLARALGVGRQAAERAVVQGAQLFIGGEMGIANTTAATALACALMGAEPAAIAGPGTGLDAAGVSHKAQVIARALTLHGEALATPIEALRRVGGFEIAALTGAFMACAQIGLPVLVDGFIASVAALTASRLTEGAGAWFLFAHRSAEPGHARVLEALGARPLLDLGMRLGEGSGAATAVPLVRLACALHDEMATFAEAGVSEKLPE